MKYTKAALFLFFNLLYCSGISQYGKQVIYYFGAQYSKDYHTLQLVDDPHMDLDSNLHLGITDAKYIKLRNLNDLNIWNEHFGLKFGYSLNPYLYFETGVIYNKGGVKITPNSLSDTLLNKVFSNILDRKEYVVEYNTIELPFTVRLKPNFDDKKSRFFPILSAGVAFGYATQNLYYYNYIENARVQRNIGLTAHVGLGLRKEIDKTMYFEINSFYKTTLINHFAYAPVQSFFQTVGVEATLGWIFRGNAAGKSSLILSCKEFSREHLKRYSFGIQYGGLYTAAINKGTNKELLTLYGHPEIDTSKVKDYTSKINGVPGFSIGLFVECKINPIFSIGFTPGFSQRGFQLNDHFNYKDSTIAPLTIQSNVRFNYLDFPVEFIFSPVNRLKLFAGVGLSVFMKDKIYEFTYSPKGYLGTPADLNDLSGYNRVLKYFGYEARTLLWSGHAGVSYDIDNRLAVALKALYSGNMMPEKLPELSISNLYAQASIILYLNKYGFKSGR
ncbi:MAG: outer membrane beta-barrel protein [Bacteroidetes bacterium]|nr:outer membrane beta-barrel protein [Bacteroidota bacterium]